MPKIRYVKHKFYPASRVRIQQVNEIIDEYTAAGYIMTVRQIFYCLVTRDLLGNTKENYKSLGNTICKGREAGLIDWNAVEDRTRNLASNSHWDDPSDIVDACASQFRLDKWARQKWRPEIFIEKDALAGVISKCCGELDVPYFSCRGYTSASAMWRAGQRLQGYIAAGQTPIIFHMGDHDPSGLDMTRDIQERLSLFAGEPILVKRTALNMDQIEARNPPPNPAKPKDARYEEYKREFGSSCWELDALDPPTLCALIEEAVAKVRDEEKWSHDLGTEHTQRADLKKVADNWTNIVENL